MCKRRSMWRRCKSIHLPMSSWLWWQAMRKRHWRMWFKYVSLLFLFSFYIFVAIKLTNFWITFRSMSTRWNLYWWFEFVYVQLHARLHWIELWNEYRWLRHKSMPKWWFVHRFSEWLQMCMQNSVHWTKLWLQIGSMFTESLSQRGKMYAKLKLSGLFMQLPTWLHRTIVWSRYKWMCIIITMPKWCDMQKYPRLISMLMRKRLRRTRLHNKHWRLRLISMLKRRHLFGWRRWLHMPLLGRFWRQTLRSWYRWMCFK